MTKSEKNFVEKQRQGITVYFAKWKAARGKPDHPNYWDRMMVKLTDGTQHTLSQEFVKNNKLNWGT